MESINQEKNSANNNEADESKRTGKNVAIITTSPLSYHFRWIFLLFLHFLDLGSDVFMIHFFSIRGHKMFFGTSLFFICLSTFLSIFWNLQLYERDIIKSLLAIIFGSSSRYVYLLVLGAEGEGKWRDSFNEGTAEVQNFYFLFAALMEDIPQAFINLIYIEVHANDNIIISYVQIASSFIMAFLKIYVGCRNLLHDDIIDNNLI